MSILAKRLKELREERKISVQELAKELNVSARAIQRWEKEDRIPNADAVAKMAKFFEISADYLLGLVDA